MFACMKAKQELIKGPNLQVLYLLDPVTVKDMHLPRRIKDCFAIHPAIHIFLYDQINMYLASIADSQILCKPKLTSFGCVKC